MARCPFAAWRPISDPEPAITPRVVIYHTMVGTLQGTENFFRNSTTLESHFGVACPKCEAEGVAKDGEIWQWRDTNLQADANLDANDFAISVETCDHFKGGTYTNPALSAKQVESWVRIGLWAADVHNIPRRRVPAWDSSGFGYHVMFGAPSHWTPVSKSCPNPTRIRQFNETVLPSIIRGELDDMTTEEHNMLAQIHQALNVLEDGTSVNQNVAFQRLYDRVLRLDTDIPQTFPTAEEIATAVVDRLPQGGSLDLGTVVAAFEEVLPRLNVNSNIFVDPS